MSELRHLGFQLEIKAVNTQERVIEGYASTYGNVDLGGDIVEDGAFADWLSSHQPADCRVLVGHDSSRLPVGVPTVIESDAKGLYCATKVFEGPSGDDLLAVASGLAAAGKPLGISIGYRIRPNGSQWRKEGGQTVRALTKLDLVEYSYTPFPMNEEATVTGVKKDDDGQKAAVGSFEWIRQHVTHELCESMQRYCSIVELFADRVIFRCYGDVEGIDQLYQAPYVVTGEMVEIGASFPVDVRYVPMAEPGDKAASTQLEQGASTELTTIAQQLATLASEVTAAQKSMAHLGLDTKAGRAMSSANMKALHACAKSLMGLHDAVCDMGESCPIGDGEMAAPSDGQETKTNDTVGERDALAPYRVALMDMDLTLVRARG